MDGLCDFCGEAFKEGDRVTNISTSTWDEDDGRMRDDFERSDDIVHTEACLAAMVD